MPSIVNEVSAIFVAITTWKIDEQILKEFSKIFVILTVLVVLEQTAIHCLIPTCARVQHIWRQYSSHARSVEKYLDDDSTHFTLFL